MNSASDVRPSLVWSVTFVKRRLSRPPPQVRHHVLAVHAVVDGEILQRLHLHDDEVPAARGAEVGPAGAQRRALGEPRASVGDLRVGGRRPQERRARVVPRVVGVIAERPELLHDRAVAEHLIELAAAQHAAANRAT